MFKLKATFCQICHTICLSLLVSCAIDFPVYQGLNLGDFFFLITPSSTSFSPIYKISFHWLICSFRLPYTSLALLLSLCCCAI